MTAGEIRDLREAMGWTPERLADHLRVSSYTIRRWEAGEVRPVQGSLRRLQELQRKQALKQAKTA